MRSRIPDRMIAPLLLAAGSIVVLVIGGAVHGWSTLPDVIPIPILAIAAMWVWGRRDTDMGAVIRRRPDERQLERRLRVQALVGRVVSAGVAVGYLVATATGSLLWPWEAMLGLIVIALVAGWLLCLRPEKGAIDEGD